jgi:dienelactone hydrolase
MPRSSLFALCLIPMLTCRAEAGTEFGTPTPPGIRSSVVEYVCQGDTLVGNIAWDGSVEGKRPVVLVVHEWWGNNDYSRRRSEMLAEAGYLALAVDLYGKGKRAQDPAGAGALAKEAYSDPARLAARFAAAIEVVNARPEADREHTAAIGYCFGGGVLLGLSRQGLELDAVASFHGSLTTETPAAPGSIKPALLVLHGEADAMVTAEHVAAFREEMAKAEARLEFVGYPGATHAFTNPAATATGKTYDLPIAYDAAADADSWKRLLAFLKAELQ